MKKQTRKRQTEDENQAAFRVVQEATGQTPRVHAVSLNLAITDPGELTEPQKNPAAVALGRLGGIKGGPARAKKLSKAKLSEIGRKAAIARWRKTRKRS